MVQAETAAQATQASVERLAAVKLQYLLPMTVIFMVSYLGLTLLAGFAPTLTQTEVVGSVNLGFILIAANYFVSWMLAIGYGRVAASKFDPLAAQVVRDLGRTGG